MEKSRTKNTIRNMKTGLIVQLINRLMAFVVRTVFIRILNSEYLGVNGLFTNILTMLSFAELGIGTAIIFNMYKPVAEEDKDKIKSLMALYKKSYNIIGIVVFIMGLCVIPFMSFIVKDAPNIKENLILIYLLFLINTSASYFFTYKKSIISAHQQESVINKINSVFYLVKSLLEIAFLFITRNYILYLFVAIVCTIIENIVIARKANKMFPYLKDKSVVKLAKDETSKIFLNVKSLVVYKLGSVIMNGTDNLLISILVNVSTVGLCSNYTMVINAIKGIVTSALNGITASIGNLNAVADKIKKEKIFYQFTFINFWIYSFCSTAFIIMLNPFIKLWLGEAYVLGIGVSIALSVSFFIDGLRNPGYTYRVTLGLFEKGKLTPYIGATVNIILSIVLCKYFGVVGIFIATSIAQLASYSWIDPYLIHKYEFKTPLRKYFVKYLQYFSTFVVIFLCCYFIQLKIGDLGLISFILNAVSVCVVPNVVILLLYRKTEEFKEISGKVIRPMLKKLKLVK